MDGNEVRIVEPGSETVLEPGGIGMIEVRGPCVFKGYWRMPEKTAEELRPNGFFMTGDLGQVSDDGYLSIVGRQKDLIITGGYNVYPKEIEDVLNDVAGVLESAVYGVHDPDFGEKIIAAVVPESDSKPETAELTAIVKDKLARFKHPREFQVMEALPRNTMGKVQKNVLRDNYAEEN